MDQLFSNIIYFSLVFLFGFRLKRHFDNKYGDNNGIIDNKEIQMYMFAGWLLINLLGLKMTDFILYKSTLVIFLLVIIFYVDMNYRIIPFELNIAIMSTGVFNIFADNYYLFEFYQLFFIVVILGISIIGLKMDVFGGGDIKLYLALLVTLGIKRVMFVILASSVIGGFVASYLLTVKKKDKTEMFPYGPSICIASVIVMYLI